MKELFDELDSLPEFINPIFVIETKKSGSKIEIETAILGAAEEQRKVTLLLNHLEDLEPQAAKETPEGF